MIIVANDNNNKVDIYAKCKAAENRKRNIKSEINI